MDWLSDRLRELGIVEKFEQERALLERDQQLEAQVLSLEQRIPSWDRLNVLHLTADEVKLNALKAEHRKVRSEIKAVDATIEEQLRGLRYETIELELASAIELGLRQARRDLWLNPPRTRPLAASLQALADKVLAQFAPELDWEDVLRGLSDEAVCRELAAREAPTEWPAGYPPINSQSLRPLVARQLGPAIFPLLKAQAEVAARVVKLEAELREVSSVISAFERINVLEKSPAEAREEELKLLLSSSRSELFRRSEEIREQAYRALSAFPPLGIYLRAMEAQSLLARVRIAHEETLGIQGKVVMAPVVAARHLVLAALRRLHEAFRRAFPAIKLPREYVSPPTPPAGPLKAFLEQVNRGHASRQRERALSHALMVASLQAEASKTRKLVSPVDQLAFWKSSEPQKRLLELNQRREWHEHALQEAERALVQATREAAHVLLGFRLRDAAQTLVEGVSRMHTDGGSSRQPKSCPVHNQEHCLRLYQALLAILNEYGLRGTYLDFLKQVAAAVPLDLEVKPDPVAGYPPVSPTQLAGMLAHRLQGTDFPAMVTNMHELIATEQRVAQELEQARSEVTVWDSLNIFTVSPAERRRDELARRRKLISPDIARLQKEIESLLGRAAESYPPAALYFSLPQVEWAIRAVRAQCHSSSRKSGSRYYRVYRCVLSGKATADAVTQRWAAALIKTYGVLPTYHALLESWELTGQGV